jgi:integrase
MPKRRKEPFGLYKRADIWWIDFTIKGRHRIRESSGTSNHARAKEIAQARYAKEWGRGIKGDRATLTFAEAVMLYISRGGAALYTKPLVAHFKDKRVADIFPGDIRAAAIELYPNASPGTRNRHVITPARAIINAAAESGLCHHIRVKSFKTLKPIRQTVDAQWLTAFRQSADPRLGALALFMMITAARIGQAVKLQWEDFDLQKAVVRIPVAKGHEERLAHLTAEMVAVLANLPREARKPVFGYRHRWNFYKPWRAACEAARIAYVPPHQAGRHTFATAMIAAGVDPKTVAARGGWKSLRLMLETYVHGDAGAEAVERVFGTFASQASKPESSENSKAKRETKR